MKELKNPITLLVLILVAAAFSAPFGTTELATFAKDFLPAVATLVAAYAGVLYGAALTQEATFKELRLRQISIGTHALFTIWRQLNAIQQFQIDIVEKYRNYPPAPLAMPPVNVPIEDTVRLDIDSLAFLLDHEKSVILANLCIAETRYINAVETIRQRSMLHANQIQPKLEGKIPKSRNLTPSELQKIVGVRLFTLLVSQTNEVISTTDDAVETLAAVELDLHNALKEIFPEGKFPISSPLENSPASPFSRPKPTGLL